MGIKSVEDGGNEGESECRKTEEGGSVHRRRVRGLQDVPTQILGVSMSQEGREREKLCRDG